jgi:hypothetical protein
LRGARTILRALAVPSVRFSQRGGANRNHLGMETDVHNTRNKSTWTTGFQFAAGFLALGMGSAAVASDAGVGVIGNYRPTAARYVMTRLPKGEKVPVQIGAIVMAGDRLVLPANASVTVQLANDETLNLKGPGDFVMPDARPLGKLAVIFQSLRPVLLDDEHRLDGTAASRGGESCGKDGSAVPAISVPILVPAARIVAGQRDLPLAWRGGCPPFEVRVLSGSDSLVYRESIEGWQVRLDDVPLGPGQYTVTVTDAANRSYAGSLEAVATGPVVPADLLADTTSLGVTAQAVWLARQDDGRWKLESFERLRPLIRAGDPLAGSIGDWVLWGSSTR